MGVLDRSFFCRPTLEVAKDLIGKTLVREHEEGLLVGRIVETEAYTQYDPAFHGWRLVDQETGAIRREGKGYDLFAAPGTAYVYLNYGMYWLLNVVTEPEGIGGAVLIRGVEPIEGIDVMRARRPQVRRLSDLTNGPGKLALAFDIDGSFHGTDLTLPPLYFSEGSQQDPLPVVTSPRIGITRGVDLLWRYYVDGNPFVSPGKPAR